MSTAAFTRRTALSPELKTTYSNKSFHSHKTYIGEVSIVLKQYFSNSFRGSNKYNLASVLLENLLVFEHIINLKNVDIFQILTIPISS